MNTQREIPIMIKSEAEEVIERIRQDLEKHGVNIGFVQEVTIPYFGCDLDHYVAQVSEAPGNWSSAS